MVSVVAIITNNADRSSHTCILEYWNRTSTVDDDIVQENKDAKSQIEKWPKSPDSLLNKFSSCFYISFLAGVLFLFPLVALFPLLDDGLVRDSTLSQSSQSPAPTHTRSQSPDY